MNAITKPPDGYVDHNLTGFGVEELNRDDWLDGMREALTDLGVPANTRRTLEPALAHFADEVRPDVTAPNIRRFVFAETLIVRRDA